MACSGATPVALMVKEALAEVIRDVQGIPGHHDTGMDGISDLMFRGFQVMARSIGSAMFERAATCVVFAGYCETTQGIRAFRMETDSQNRQSINEVLRNVGEIEIFGSGREAAVALLPSAPTYADILETLQKVIDDPKVQGVGGNAQYGEFKGKNFQPMGVAVIGNSGSGVHYWRGPLDLNGPDFDQTYGLLPLLPYLNNI